MVGNLFLVTENKLKIQSIPYGDIRQFSITAQQLNRSGASVVDAALQANKEDVTRLVGRDAIAGAWEINIFAIYCLPLAVMLYKKTTLIAGSF